MSTYVTFLRCLVLCWWSVELVLAQRGYPVSGSWFKESDDTAHWDKVLSDFKKIGGDTVLQRGVHFENRTANDIRSDPTFSDCVIGEQHCIDITKSDLAQKGIVVEFWLTYSSNENFSDYFTLCKGLDIKVKTENQIFTRIVLSTEESRDYNNCTFKYGSNVAVLLTAYTINHDPHYSLLQKAMEKNMSVYFGLAKLPYIRNDKSSGDLMQAYYFFLLRLMMDHQLRYKNFTALKGYYSDEEVVPAYIMHEPKHRNTSLPPNYVPLYLRELLFTAGAAGYKIIGSPVLDLTHQANTSLEAHINGLKILAQYAPIQLAIKDGRGEGRAAYYTKDQMSQSIHDVDRRLWQILKQRNQSITEKTAFKDIYYASITELFSSVKTSLPESQLWLTIEAYDDIAEQTWCSPIDTSGSGMDKKVQSVRKSVLDEVIAAVGSKVSKITAFAWDPLFLCKNPSNENLLEEIENNIRYPIISECRFHSPQNLSVVVIGYNIDGTYSKFQVTYEKYDGKSETTELYGYYFELDYGIEHHLDKSLVYIQLFDIPDLNDLKKNGTITVGIDGGDQKCTFDYSLN